ncbi:MAG: hypothetical protein ACUVV4_06765 [Candidatus Bathyarchaeia archaeon]
MTVEGCRVAPDPLSLFRALTPDPGRFSCLREQADMPHDWYPPTRLRPPSPQGCIPPASQRRLPRL